MARLLARTAAWLLILVTLIVVLLVSATRLHADTPVGVVSDNVEEWSVGAGLLYWANNCFADEQNTFAALKRKPVGGGTERTLESINDGARCITYRNMLASSDGLYYFDESEARIERMPLAEPYTPQVVKALSNAQKPGGRAFVESNGYLYWVDGISKIFRTRKDGSGEVETVAETASAPSDVMLVGNTVYWTDSSGVWLASVGCATLPCEGKSQFAAFGATSRGYGLLYQSVGGVIRGNYRIYWVQRTTSGSNTEYQIRYRSCNEIAVCVFAPVDAGDLFYTSTTNWFIGGPVFASGNLYWTELDTTTVNSPNGDLKRRAFNASAPGADTIATAQARIDDQLFVAGETLFFSRRGVNISSIALNATAIVRDFGAEGIEVTQAIQNLANSVPLVANKTTYVRAYARQLSGPSTANVEARLAGTRGGAPLPGSPLRPLNGIRALTTGAGFDRARLNDGWYFLLPASWISAGTIDLKLEIDARQIHSDPNRANNELAQAVSFQNQPPVCVRAVPVRTHTPLPSVNDPNFFAMIDHFKRRWPTPDVWVFRDSSAVEELQVCTYGPFPYPCHGPYELEDGWGLTNGIPDRDKVIASLWARAQLSFNPDACDDIGAPVHFMGMVHPDANNGGAAGYASTVSNQSWVQLPDHLPNPIPPSWDAIREGSVMAQELAHNYGRKHVNCGSPDNIDTSFPYPPCQIAPTGAASYYGFDVTSLQPIRPDQTSDFMSYSRRSWVSDYTWRALLNSFRASNAREAEALAAEPQQGNSVFVSGLVDMDNSRGELGVVLVLPTGSVPPGTRLSAGRQGEGAGPQHESGPHASFTLRVLDAAGGVLVERPLTLTELDDHSPESHAALFSDLFPQPGGPVAEVQLLAGGSVIDSVRPGASPPTISIFKPAGGALIENELTVQWTAHDPDAGDSLLFTVQYSHDNGASWHTLALNLPDSPDPTRRLSLGDLSGLHGSGTNTALVRVLASDGYNTAIATSQPFTLRNRPPLPVILTPAAGQTFPAAQDIALVGSATDAEDGGLSGPALSWQVDGLDQGSGGEVSVAGLAPGAHLALLGASDSLGQRISETVSFNVAPLALPLDAAPALDGSCEDASYAAGNSLRLKPYGDGSQGSVRVLRSGEYLWACFVGLRLGASEPGASVGIHADIDNSRDALAQPTDAGFFVGEDGDVFTRAGDGAGGFVAPGPGGFQAQVAAGAAAWSAELRIERATLGGWDRLVGLNFGHYSVALAGDDYLWPYTASASRPDSWARSALGDLPVLTAIEPFSATVASSPLTLTVTGSGFVSGTAVLWNGEALPTSFVGDEQLTAEVGAAQLASAAAVEVKTRAPSGLESNAATFVVEPLTPQISGLTPASAIAGSPGLTLVVSGGNFAPDAQILWDGEPLPTQFVSANQLQAQVAPGLLVSGQGVGVAVRNNQPNEQISAVATFTVEQSNRRSFRLPAVLR
jgi:hypothetical protein